MLRQNLIGEFSNKLKKLLLEIAEKSDWLVKYSKYRFELTGIEYKESVISIHSSNENEYNFSLVYSLFHSDYMESFAPYNRYFIDLRNMSVIGFRMED